MKKNSFIFVLLLLLTYTMSYADDGSWNVSHQESKGNLYSDNPYIVLEKEILKFDAFKNPNVIAIFQFKNMVNKPLKIEAGFPIQLRIPITIMEDRSGLKYHFLLSKYGPNKHMEIIKILLGSKLKIDNTIDEMETSQEYITKNDIVPRTKLSPEKLQPIYQFQILQNNKKVDFDFVIVDSKISENYLEVMIHFHHFLSFEPAETSIVSVSYYEDCTQGMEPHPFFGGIIYNRWEYILGTGGTWKDSIKELYFVLPHTLELGKLPQEFKTVVALNKDYKVYIANNYKPKKNETIQIEWKEYSSQFLEQRYHYIWFEQPEYVNAARKVYYNIVKYRNCSSFIKQKTVVYTPQGIVKDIDFSAINLFDGIKETSWCEAVQGDGKEEWVEFELLFPVQGLQIQNGFNKSFYKIEGKDIDSLYEKNNRVKELEFVSSDGTIRKRIVLEDKKDLQSFDIKLPKGIYKIYIKDIYKGTKWQDTCLGEIVFFIDIQDDFFKKYFK